MWRRLLDETCHSHVASKRSLIFNDKCEKYLWFIITMRCVLIKTAPIKFHNENDNHIKYVLSVSMTTCDEQFEHWNRWRWNFVLLQWVHLTIVWRYVCMWSGVEFWLDLHGTEELKWGDSYWFDFCVEK